MGLRVATTDDLTQILSIYGPYVENTTVSFEYEVPSVEAFSSRFRQITAQFPWLVWEEDGKVLGYAYACAPFSRAAYRWCAEPSIYIHPDHHGKGIAESCISLWKRCCACRAIMSVMPSSPRKTPVLWPFIKQWVIPFYRSFPAVHTNLEGIWASFGWKNG